MRESQKGFKQRRFLLGKGIMNRGKGRWEAGLRGQEQQGAWGRREKQAEEGVKERESIGGRQGPFKGASSE